MLTHDYTSSISQLPPSKGKQHAKINSLAQKQTKTLHSNQKNKLKKIKVYGLNYTNSDFSFLFFFFKPSLHYSLNFN